MNNLVKRMGARLGLYGRTINTSVDGLEDRLRGSFQQDRMIMDKLNSLRRALWHSYQGADIYKLDQTEPIRALINPNKLTQNYDDKILSVESQYKFKCGDVFQWKRTQTYWLIYLQDKTELAYFKGDIRRCKHKIGWRDENGQIHSVFAAVRGPVESKINFIQKGGNSVDEPNHSLSILIPLTEETQKYFVRYGKFYLQTLDSVDKSTCWRVEATDHISLDGVLEITAVEHYINESTDDLENGIVNGLIELPLETSIIGDSFISPKMQYEYIGNSQNWNIESDYEIETQITPDGHLLLLWPHNYSGEFIIKNGEDSKTITVNSLF